MKLNEIKQKIKDYEELTEEIDRIKRILGKGIYEVVIKENYFRRDNLFASEKFNSEVENLLQQELDSLKGQRSDICKQLNIEEESE